MPTIANLTVYTSQVHGKWVAATARAPFFCFEADTEDKALEIAASALKFFVSAPSGQAAAPSNFERFTTKNRIRASELAPA